MTRRRLGSRASHRSLWRGSIVLSLGLACASSATPPAGAGGEAGAPPVAHPYGTSACGTCVAMQCSGAVASCGEDPECASFLTCTDACPTGASGDADATCASRCPAPSGTAGQQALAAFDACRAGTAAAACAACGDAKPDAGLIPLLQETCPASQAADPCERCDQEKCCAIDDACTANAECLAVIDCIPDTATYADVLACMMEHPEGAGVFAQRSACRLVLCNDTTSCQAKPPACDACYAVHCPDAFAELVGTLDGFALYYGCVGGPCSSIDDPVQYLSCIDMCRSTYPSAAAAYDDFYLCETTRCPSSC